MGTLSLGPNMTVENRSASTPASNGTPPGSKFPEKVKAFFRNHNYNVDSHGDNDELVFSTNCLITGELQMLGDIILWAVIYFSCTFIFFFIVPIYAPE
ncbi:unnamed protein product [Toxocara canis]|uniref:Transmembrane protein n=1 Tax=Toxocara canis TaxID=6265 RepID=A0A183U9K3_TOXCA|nr:unnamed protein product [Toxocara canis]